MSHASCTVDNVMDLLPSRWCMSATFEGFLYPYSRCLLVAAALEPSGTNITIEGGPRQLLCTAIHLQWKPPTAPHASGFRIHPNRLRWFAGSAQRTLAQRKGTLDFPPLLIHISQLYSHLYCKWLPMPSHLETMVSVGRHFCRTQGIDQSTERAQIPLGE